MPIRPSLFLRPAAIVWLATVTSLTAAAPAAAQETPRYTFTLNGAFQVAPPGFESTTNLHSYGEEATFRSAHAINGSAAADVGVMLHVGNHFGVAAAFSWTSARDTGTAGVNVPHPLLFSAPRTAAEVFERERIERAVHVSAAWRIRLGTRAELTVSGGPTALNVTQHTVVHWHVAEVGPPDFDQIVLETVIGEHRRNAVGGHVGIDLLVMATRHVGFGYFVRFARASVDLPGSGETTIRANAGNVQTGAGLRVRF